MYKVYTTNYKPYWINSENKPSYDYFSQINFNWTLINGGVNYDSEQLISITVPNLDHIYFKIEEVDKKDVVKSVKYFYFDSVFRRLDNGFVVRCELDIWASYNINIEKHFIDNNSFVKFRRGSINLNNFIQYPVYVDSLLNSINDWKSKNNPKYTEISSLQLKNENTEPAILGSNFVGFPPQIYIRNTYDNDVSKNKSWTIQNAQIYPNFEKFNQKNYIFNKYLVVEKEGAYLVFPDLSDLNKTIDDYNKADKGAILTFSNTGESYNTGLNGAYDLPILTITAQDKSNNQGIKLSKFNNKLAMEYLINKTEFAAKKDVSYFYGPDLSTLIQKFKPDWRIYCEYDKTQPPPLNNWTRIWCWLYFIIPFQGLEAKNIFDIDNTANKTLTADLKSDSYISNGEKDIIVGNTNLKLKQMINNNYWLRFDISGFQLIPTNQTNYELFNTITFGSSLPTNKDLYYEYIASVRNSVNTGFWTNYAQKQFQLGQKAIGGVFNSLLSGNIAKGLANTAFNTVSNAIGLDFQNSLLIANAKAKFADVKNSVGLKPQTSNIEDIIYYQIPQNWLVNTKNLTPNKIISYQYSKLDWLETTIVDINNLFLYYGFEINSTYNYNKIAENENFYYVQIDSEYLSREVNNLYPLNLDFGVKLDCMNEWTAGIRIFKKDYVESNIKWTVKK